MTAPMDDATTQAKRTVLRMFPYGLFVVTARGGDGEVNGFTANWVTQAGFEPPMVALVIASDAHSLGLIRSGQHFAINVIEDGNKDLLRRLGRPHFKAPDKLDGIDLTDARNGTPVLSQALGYVECALRGELQYNADHQIIVGEVIDAGVFREGATQTMSAAGMKYSG